MDEKIKKTMNAVSSALEIIMGLIVVAAIIAAIIFLKEPFVEFCNNHADSEAFIDFIKYVLNIVIGIEFFKMLCKPGTDTILDIMMFVITRHMIIDETDALENLLTILGVAILIVIKRYVKSPELAQLLKRKKESNKDDTKIELTKEGNQQ